MAGVRLNQQLSQGYNPDGTPGTVAAGLPGPPGPPPTDAQVLAAVSTYLQTTGLPPTQATGSTTALTGFGAGAAGFSGAYVALGDNQTVVSGYVMAKGSTPDVDLHLAGQGVGAVQVDSTLQINHGLTVSSGAFNVATSSWSLSTVGDDPQQVQLAPTASHNGVVVYNPTLGTYQAVFASAFTVSSDRSLKSDITPLSGSLAEVRTTPAYSYVMNGEQRRGLIADEAPKALLRIDNEGTQMLDLYDMVGTLWNAVRELAEKVGE